MAYQTKSKKKELLVRREEILRDIKYFEKRIEEARSQKTNSSYVVDDDDSDSDDFALLGLGPSVADLKLEQSNLQTFLHATQELTNVCILQSEVNVMVNDPVYEGEPAVTEPGIWREVTADCRVDLVPFSITFYIHKSNRLFGPTSYRGLRVSPVKAAHENELARSILPRVYTPSDAVEVLRSYAVAHRSRRTTLARLAEKYSNSLFMEPMAEGGYIMKCANLLEVSWTLENKWSPVAAFHHRMKFDLEYMDEAYVKIISQAHRELSDPTLEIDERTRLMSKIIATCLVAQGPTQELYESMESDIESENLRKRRTTLDEEIEEPVNKKKKDSEIMAPPKTLPKKTKPKGKENNAVNKVDRKTIKRSGTVDGVDEAKKAKLSDKNLVKSNNTNIKDKVNKEDGNKTSNDKVSISNKTNVDKNNERSVSDKEKSIGITKNSNKDKTIKNTNANTKNYPDKENVTKQKEVVNKAVHIKKYAEPPKLDDIKNADLNIKNSMDTMKNSRETAANMKNVDKQNLKVKSINEKNIANVENSSKPVNNKKNKKLPDLESNKEKNSNNVNKNPKLIKHVKNVEETNSEVTKVKSSKSCTVEGNRQNNNDKPKVNKVSNNQKNIDGKDDKVNIAKLADTKTKHKTKSTMNENVASVDDCLNIDSSNKTNVAKSKSMDRPKTSNFRQCSTLLNSKSYKNDPALIKKDTKIVNNPTVKNDRIIINDNNMNQKSKDSLKDKIVKSSKTSKKEKMAEDNIKEINQHLNKPENIEHAIKEKPINSLLQHKNVKNLNIEKTVNSRDLKPTKTKQDGTQPKLIVKDVIDKTKLSNKVTGKIDKHDKTEKKNGVDLKNLTDKKSPTESNFRNSIETNKNAEQNLPKQKIKTNSQSLANINSNKNKVNENNLNPKNTIQNIIKTKVVSKNLRQSPHTNKINLLNPRNKLSISKLRVKDIKKPENDVDKDKHDKNKIVTKIPQKLTSVREQIKKNPLRISPRKSQSSLKTNSQNSSRSSLRSIQKAMTGIPRLMKKPIRKA